MLATMDRGGCRSSLTDALGRYFASRGDIRLALLFGSRARGTATEDSDVDLAVDAPGVPLEELSGELAQLLGLTVDISALREMSIPLLEAVVSEGVVVFGAQSGLAASWRSQALAELETDLPWYRRMRDAWLERVAERGFSDGE